MKFRPLHDRVVVRRIDAEDKTKGGIIIPDSAKEKPQEGEIIAVGSGARDESGKLIPLDVKAGDRVLFGKWSGTEVKIDGEDLLIMKEADILGVIRAVGREEEGRVIQRRHSRSHWEELLWPQKMYDFQAMPGHACCEASIFSPMRSKSRSVPKAATLCSKILRGTAHHQGRRDGRQRNRTRRQVRKHGRAMVREVASKSNDVAGDGTTTATVLAQAIVREGAKSVAAGMNPMDLKRGVDLAVAAVVKNLKKRAKKVEVVRGNCPGRHDFGEW